MKNIVFLDAATADFGDIELDSFKTLGHFKQYDLTEDKETADRLKDAEIVITNKVPINKAIMELCPNLKLICLSATGYNIIDIEEAKKRKIAVSNVAGYSTASVAQLTVSFILALGGNLIKYNEASHDGTWSASKIFCLGTWPVKDVAGLTLGILGYGDIGQAVATVCEVLGMKIIALGRDGVDYNNDVQRVTIDQLIEQSDFISLHMPLTNYSKGLIDINFLKKMKDSAFLINMARGPIVHQGDLAQALHEGIIAGAALDVLEEEPPDKNDPILNAPNCIITPHIAWASRESRQRLIDEIVLNIKAFEKGFERNRIV